MSPYALNFRCSLTMRLGLQKFGTWLTALSVIACGMLSSVAHTHGPTQAGGMHAGTGHSAVHFHFHSHFGDSVGHSHVADPATTSEHEIPFLPEHDSDFCVDCQLLADAGNLDASPVNMESLENSQTFRMRKACWFPMDTLRAYQGRAPPCSLLI